MRKRLEPSDVFFPRDEVDPEYFVYREELNDIAETLEEGGVPILLGNSGTGKTSLIKYLLEKQFRSNALLITITSSSSIDSIRNQTYRFFEGEFEVIGSKGGGGISAGGGAGTMGPNAHITVERAKKIKEKVKSDIIDEIISLSNNGMLILDNLERANEELRNYLMDLIIVSCSSSSSKLILSGVDTSFSNDEKWLQSEKLRDYDRRYEIINISPLSLKQGSQIVRTGMDKLNLNATDKLCEMIARLALGHNYLIHRIAKRTAEIAMNSKNLDYIDNGSFESALQSVSSKLTNKDNEVANYKIPNEDNRFFCLGILAYCWERPTLDQIKRYLEIYFDIDLPAIQIKGILNDFVNDNLIGFINSTYYIVDTEYKLVLREKIRKMDKTRSNHLLDAFPLPSIEA